jgi:hypothetical protein
VNFVIRRVSVLSKKTGRCAIRPASVTALRPFGGIYYCCAVADRSGIPLLPKSLLATIAVIGFGVAAIGLYFDFTNAKWFTSHPFTTNLMSGVVGFCTVTFVVGVGFAMLTERALVQQRRQAVVDVATSLLQACNQVTQQMTRDFARGMGVDRDPSPRPTYEAAAACRATAGSLPMLRNKVEEYVHPVAAFHLNQVLPYADKYLSDASNVIMQRTIAAMTDLIDELQRIDAGQERNRVVNILTEYFTRCEILMKDVVASVPECRRAAN